MSKVSKKNAAKNKKKLRLCQEKLSCPGNTAAQFECAQCGTLQCEECEKVLHENSRFVFHERSPLEELAVDQNNSELAADQLCSSSVVTRNNHHQAGALIDVSLDDESDPRNHCDNDQAPPRPLTNNHKPHRQSKASSSQPINGMKNTSHQHLGNSGGSDSIQSPLPDIAQMSLDYVNYEAESDIAVMSLSPPRDEPEPLQESYLLVDQLEKMQVANADEFAAKLGCSDRSLVKVVSIFGNTGEGKSHTLNYTFYNGKEVFKTSPAQSSCTVGIWAACSQFGKNRVITIDTEGLLGVSKDNERRTRLLLKVLAISDVIIYRTRAERLHNDLFTFLGDASRAYCHHFTRELKEAASRCKFSRPISDLGPVVVIFHETLHTDVLDTVEERTAEDVLRSRFCQMGLSTEAFSAFEYVGTRTTHPPTSFKELKDCMERHLNNNTVRSARTPTIVFTALSVLNDKFNGSIERTFSSTFPDEYFTCSAICLSCGGRCKNSMNHDDFPHKSNSKCVYQHQYENKRFLCRRCYDRGDLRVVVPKTSASNEGTWLGLASYAISGYVLECSRCGVIYRSRQYWYGNEDPSGKDVHTEIQHVWEGEPGPLQGTQNAAQRLLDGVSYISESVASVSAGPANKVKSWVADQIAPPYWVPNHKITRCGQCDLEFGDTDTKHHCRNCGNGFCDECSQQKCKVPERGWGEEEVRVCKRCYVKITEENSRLPPCEPAEVIARKVGEKIQGTVGSVVSVIQDYPISCIKDYARPDYWKPDAEIKSCCVCEAEFNEKLPIHHCRACGNGVCHPCSQTKKPVKSRGWDTPVRVCDTCNKKPSL